MVALLFLSIVSVLCMQRLCRFARFHSVNKQRFDPYPLVFTTAYRAKVSVRASSCFTMGAG